MAGRKTDKNKRSFVNIMIRVSICSAVLALGIFGMLGLTSLKKPPTEAISVERAIKVDAVAVEPLSHPVVITGYGEAKALKSVSIASEVSGKIVYVHPRLKAGETLLKDEILFKVDDTSYKASHREARAGVDQWVNAIDRLKKQFAIDKDRLKTLERSKALAWDEFDRVKKLLEVDRVGTRSGVDQAERAFNTASDLTDQMAQSVTLYPIRIKEAKSSLESARARALLARTSLERCTVRAMFNARVKQAMLEAGQYVSPGQNIVTLADDSVLEIQVPLDSRDARKWLKFRTDGDNSQNTAWFGRVEEVNCHIQWTEDKTGDGWTGILHRVVDFDQKTRTITVAVRYDGKSATGRVNKGLPLVEGMFCMVKIPGRVLTHVFKLPRHAVSFENTVYTVDKTSRLKTVSVTIARKEGEDTFISGGIKTGDVVITTRLIDPLENVLLEIINQTKESGS